MIEQTAAPWDIDRSSQDADEASQRRLQLEQEDMREVMAEPSGRRVLRRVLDMAGVYRSSFTGDNRTFFLEGQRNVGLMLIGQIQAAAPDRYVDMMIEDQPGHE